MPVHGVLVQLVAHHTGVRGAEMNVAPVGHLPKAKVNRKPAEQRSTGHGSAMRDYCEADRANEMSETRLRIRYAPQKTPLLHGVAFFVVP